MHKGQLLATYKSYLAPDKIETYKQYQPKILNGEYDLRKVKSYDDLLKEYIQYKVAVAIKKKSNFKASAVAIDGRTWASGIVGGIIRKLWLILQLWHVVSAIRRHEI